MITIVDYGVGNPRAFVNMFDYVGLDARVTRDADVIAGASHLILPGVGAFDAAMVRLRESQLIASLEAAVFQQKTPLLGVCLGMQLLGRRSEEGSQMGLGWINGDVRRIERKAGSALKVPFMGWKEIDAAPGAKLFQRNATPRFYFSHSYAMHCDAPEDVAATYSAEGEVVCAVQHDNIYGVQFHPEKSSRFGMALLTAFVEKSRQ